MTYADFLARKTIVAPPVGIPNPPELHPSLFPFQADVTRWGLRRGRAALFEECGLGKSRQALEWSRVVCEHTRGSVLVLTPLAVAQQFVREGEAIDVPVTHCREASDARPGVNVTNYERFERFDPASFAGVVCDESSILKAKDGKTRNSLVERWSQTRFRLACTATPAPNDHLELGNHAEFLGVMTMPEMLSMFFVHDGGETQKWRLKGHAQKEFWRWVCSWAVCLTKPSTLGYSDEGYELPGLRVHEHVITSDLAMAHQAGQLFALDARTLDELRAARRASLPQRVAKAAELANGDAEQWLIWCDLNAESDALTKAIPGAVEIAGSHSDEHKEQAILDFIDGKTRVIVTKPSLAGFGLNLQNCHKTAFVGLSHSFEQWHQATRRLWRFGQKHEVESHIITSSAEGAVLESVKRKRAAFDEMIAGMAESMADISRAEISAARRDAVEYRPRVRMNLPEWMHD
jgi:hypothetical protein